MPLPVNCLESTKLRIPIREPSFAELSLMCDRNQELAIQCDSIWKERLKMDFLCAPSEHRDNHNQYKLRCNEYCAFFYRAMRDTTKGASMFSPVLQKAKLDQIFSTNEEIKFRSGATNGQTILNQSLHYLIKGGFSQDAMQAQLQELDQSLLSFQDFISKLPKGFSEGAQREHQDETQCNNSTRKLITASTELRLIKPLEMLHILLKQGAQPRADALKLATAAGAPAEALELLSQSLK